MKQTPYTDSVARQFHTIPNQKTTATLSEGTGAHLKAIGIQAALARQYKQQTQPPSLTTNHRQKNVKVSAHLEAISVQIEAYKDELEHDRHGRHALSENACRGFGLQVSDFRLCHRVH